MVSFFGLKIGGDKKKPQTKETKQPQQQQWKRIDQNTLGEGQYFGTDLKRPAFPSSRPGSVQSAAGAPVLWNSPYAGPAMTSSMVDLSVPAPGRKQSFSSLRAVNNTPDANLTSRWGSGSAVDLTPPAAFANSRPGTPTRPGTAGSSRKKEWVNPLDVHFCKPVTGASRPGTPGRNSIVKTTPRASVAPPETVPQPSKEPSKENRFSSHARAASSTRSMSTHTRGASSSTSIGDHGRAAIGSSIEPVISQTGYPSPPKSVSPVSTVDNQAFINKPIAPSTLRQVDLARLRGPLSPPSPASSASPTTERPQPETEDEEEWAVPVIQNVRAKRDTLTYHPPRRQSVTMEVETQAKDEQMQAQTQAQPQPQPQDQPERQEDRVLDEPWVHARRERRFEVDEEQHARPRNQQVEGLSGNFDAFDFGESVRPQTVEPVKQDQQVPPPRRSRPTIDMVAANNYNDGRRPSAPEAWHSTAGNEADQNDASMMQRGRPRFAPPPSNQSWSTPSSPVRGQRSEWRGPPGPADLPMVPPPRAASRPRAPDAVPHFAQRQGGPPRAAAGAHPGNRDRMAYGPTALNPPPARGFQPQSDNEGRSHNRAPPPRPLRVPGPVVDLRRSPDHPPLSPLSPNSPLSSEAPPTGESDYFSAAETALPRRVERPPSSPYSRGPMEGDFPMHKGLPRGRRPDPPPGESFAPVSPFNPNSSSRWRQWRSSFVRSPTGDSRHPQQPQDQREDSATPEHGYTLPSWDDFDERSDRHRSAIPPPLTPYSPYSPWSGGASSSSVASPTPPRLPSPTFPSLEKSISSSNENLAKTFELFYEDSRDQVAEPAQAQLQPEPQQQASKPQVPLISPVANDFSEHMRNPSPRRVDAVKAPPRPAPIAVPPSPREGLPGSEFGMRSPALRPGKEFSAGFI